MRGEAGRTPGRLRAPLVMVLFAGGLAPSQGVAQAATCPEGAAWRSLVLAHVERYPELESADLYKLLHQATMGAEHAVAFGDARAWLDRETASLGPGPAEPLIDRLGPGEGFARVHLRPFFENGGVAEELLTAFVATSRGRPGDRRGLICALDEARRLASEGALPALDAEWEPFLSERAAEGYPAVDHSASYRARYRPAYRVVSSGLVESLARR